LSDLDLIFGGPGIEPETLDAKQTLAVAHAYVEALSVVATYEWITDEPPFRVSLTGLGRSPLKYIFSRTAYPDSLVSEGDSQRSWALSPKRLTEYARNPKASPVLIRKKLTRLFALTTKLPANVNAHVAQEGDRWSWSISDATRLESPTTTNTAQKFRATIIKSGGVRPRVQLASRSDSSVFSLNATRALAERAGRCLYRQVDVTAKLKRILEPPSYPVIGGMMLDFEVLKSNQDPVKAFDDWYADMGRPILTRSFEDGEASSNGDTGSPSHA
jgi:hypothetical protein